MFSGQIPKLKPAAKWIFQAQAREIEGAEDRATYGLSAEFGVIVLDDSAASDAAPAGWKTGDVILTCNGKEATTVADLRAMACASS